MAMNKEKASGIIVLVIICCVFMALIETIIEPAYIVKSALKVVAALLGWLSIFPFVIPFWRNFSFVSLHLSDYPNTQPEK